MTEHEVEVKPGTAPREAGTVALPSGGGLHAMLALQRSAGNRATAALVQRRSLQREPELQRRNPDDELDGGVPLPGGVLAVGPVPAGPPDGGVPPPGGGGTGGTGGGSGSGGTGGGSGTGGTGGGSGGTGGSGGSGGTGGGSGTGGARGTAPAVPGSGVGSGGTAPTGAGGSGPGVTPLPTTPPRSPDPANPASGTNWDAFFAQFNDPANLARTFLEVTRPIPIAGLFTGMAADFINFYQDLNAVPADSPFTTTVVVIRDGVMIVNNVLGSLASLDQWVQDLATGSVVFVEADAVTAPVQTGIKTAKMWADGIQLGLDVVIMASAAYNAAHAANPEDAQKWNALLTNFEANTLGDTLTTVIDAIDLATFGAANAENAKQVINGTRAVVPAAQVVKDLIRGILMGWFGIYGGGIPLLPTVGTGGSPSPAAPGASPAAPGASPAAPGTSPAPDPVNRLVQRLEGDSTVSPMLRAAASGIIRGEIAKMRLVYDAADTALGEAADNMRMVSDAMTEALKSFTDGEDPVRFFCTRISEGLDHLNNEVTNLIQVQSAATAAKERTDAIVSGATELEANINGIRVPRITLPTEGSGGVIDAAVGLAQTQVVDRLTNQAQSMVDGVKSTAIQPIVRVKGSAAEISEFSVILQQTAANTVGILQGKIQSFSSSLARCNSVEDIVNTMIGQISQALGLGEGFTVDDVRQGWAELGQMLEQADAWAAGLAGGPGVQRRVDRVVDQSGLAFAAPTDPPPNRT